MDFILKEVPICADKEFEMIKITDDVRKVVEESGSRLKIIRIIIIITFRLTERSEETRPDI